jgi:hypothetical protein
MFVAFHSAALYFGLIECFRFYIRVEFIGIRINFKFDSN